MALFPRSNVGRSFVGIYALACAALLWFAWVQQSIHDMPEAFFWLMVFLTFPIGYGAAMVYGVTYSLVASSSPSVAAAYHPFWDVVPLWVTLAIAGYVQWFVLIPWYGGGYLRAEPSNNALERSCGQRGRAVLAIDGVLAGAEWAPCLAAQLSR